MKTLIEIMARSVGARPQQNKNCDVEYLMGSEELERFASLVRADAIAEEREACLEIADECADSDMHASMAANAIRARSNT